MANALYELTKAKMLQAGINMSSGDVKVSLIDTGTYTFSQTHEFYDDLSGVVATSGNLGSKTFTNGVFDAADVTFTGVSGATAEALVIWVDTGNPATSPLIAYLDTNLTNMPVTPNGGDITVSWNASGIFKL